MQTDEAELIAQSLDGNNDAYAELIDRYKNAVFYHCYAIVRDEQSAEDVTQETFIAAYYALNRYDATYRLSTWLFRISTNKALNHIKRHKPEVRNEEAISLIESVNPGPERHAQTTELHDAVARLKPKYRAVISLYYWQGLSCQETAIAMHAPLGSVKVWLKRAKATLRKELS